jgi:hypothetical protein
MPARQAPTRRAIRMPIEVRVGHNKTRRELDDNRFQSLGVFFFAADPGVGKAQCPKLVDLERPGPVSGLLRPHLDGA